MFLHLKENQDFAKGKNNYMEFGDLAKSFPASISNTQIASKLIAKIGVDTAENGALKVCQK